MQLWVLLDLSVVFSTIDHGILLDHLSGLGFRGTILPWFQTHLVDGSLELQFKPLAFDLWGTARLIDRYMKLLAEDI